MDKIKDIFKLAEKSPQINKFSKQCSEIRNGHRKTISKKVIDDAFDAFGVLVKNVTNEPDEILEFQKKLAEHYQYNIIKSKNVIIEE